jgi:DNA polymerase III sliding clamp (beta) subunit (PCNA family)
MKVKAGELLNALQLLHNASSAFGSKYFANYFSLECDGSRLRMSTSSQEAVAEAVIENIDEAEPLSAVTTTKIFRLLQLIPSNAEVKITADESEVKISAGRSTWHVPRMNVDELPMPPLEEEEILASIPLQDSWKAFQSFLHAVAPYTEGVSYIQQPSVYFQISAEEGICYCVGFARTAALIEKIPVESDAYAEALLPYNFLKPLLRVTPLELQIYASGARFIGSNWWLLIPALAVEAAEHRFFRRIYEKTKDEYIKVRFSVDKATLRLALQRLKTVVDISGSAKLAGGTELRFQPQKENGEILVSAYGFGGTLLAEEVLPVRDLTWEMNGEATVRISSKSLANAANAFEKGNELEFAFALNPNSNILEVGRVTSPSHPEREAYFTLLRGGE